MGAETSRAVHPKLKPPLDLCVTRLRSVWFFPGYERDIPLWEFFGEWDRDGIWQSGIRHLSFCFFNEFLLLSARH